MTARGAVRRVPARELTTKQLQGRLAGLANRTTSDPAEIAEVRAELARRVGEQRVTEAITAPDLTPDHRRMLAELAAELAASAA
jgi:hypothetical protein